MNKIWMLSISNLRKNRGNSISLFLILLVAVVLMNLGFLITLNFSKAFDKKAEEDNSAHVITAMYKQYYKDSYLDYFDKYPGVTETEKEEIIYLWTTRFKYGSGEFVTPSLILNMDFHRNISSLSFVGDLDITGNHDIFLSYILHTGGGYHLGDDFTLYYNNKSYVFHVAGFTQDIHLGSITLGCIGLHLPEESYRWLHQEINEPKTDGILIKARLANNYNSQDMIADFNQHEIAVSKTWIATSMWVSSYTLAKEMRTMTANIGGAIIIGFSFIIVLVSLLIMKYRVTTGIQDCLADIGTLKALGYTSAQIIRSILYQYLILGCLGAVTGIAVSYVFIDKLSNMFSAQTGIVWKQGFDGTASLLSFSMIFIPILILIPLSAIPISKLAPMVAYRTGINTHNFKKDLFPIAKMKGRLNFILTVKSMMINLGQNLRISVIIAAISFTSVFAVVVYYNIATNNKAFLDMIGSEMCSVIVTTYGDDDASLLRNEILSLKKVKKAINYDYLSVAVNNEGSQVMIIDDSNLLETNQVYKGRYPDKENEIAISSYMAKRFQKTIGNSITVQMGNASAEYEITGLIQSTSNIGMNITMTMNGVRRMLPNYSYRNVNVYLNLGINSDLFMKELKGIYGERIKETINMQELTDSQLGIYVLITSIFATVIMIITALIISLTLYLIIKALIIRRRKEFGIQKAIGYTTFQLMLHTAFSFLPVVLLGTLVGSILGSFYINPMVSLLFKGIGIMKVAFVVPTVWIFLMCLGICIFGFSISLLVSLRIRKITAYTLIEE
jgi:putative ABC transport system permease protein